MAPLYPLSLLRLLLLLLAPPLRVSGFELVVLHTNDVHARVEETGLFSGACSTQSSAEGGCFGGVARRATLVRRAREQDVPVLLLDAGDQFQGTVWFSFYKGAEAAHFMNLLQYDAMALGNHEFDNGVEGLMKPFLEQINCSIVSSNIRTDSSSSFGTSYSPYKILTVRGERVAVVGYTSRETPALSDPGPHVHFEDEVSALQRQVDKLQTLGVNKIIALGHSGFTEDQRIAQRVRGVDIVIGGHTNTFLYTGPPPSVETPSGPYPFMVRADDGRQVPVVQAYAFGKYLGQLHVRFDADGNLLHAEGNPVLLDSSIPQDPEVLSDVLKWRRSLSEFSSKEVGQTLVFLNGSSQACRFRECNLGNLIADAMVDSALGFSEENQWNHVSAAIYNGGGVRASIDETTRNGSINMEDLLAVMPFGGTFDLVTLKGSTIRKIFEHSVRRYGQSTGEFLQVSGFRVEFDLSRLPGSRLLSLSILCTSCREPQYQEVQQEVLYKLLLPSFLVSGGDGYSVIREEVLKHDSGDLDVSVVSAYISKLRLLHPSIEGRITLRNHTNSPSVSLIMMIIMMIILILLQY